MMWNQTQNLKLPAERSDKALSPEGSELSMIGDVYPSDRNRSNLGQCQVQGCTNSAGQP